MYDTEAGFPLTAAYDYDVDLRLRGVTTVESTCVQAGLPMSLLGKDFQIVLGKSLLHVKRWPTDSH